MARCEGLRGILMVLLTHGQVDESEHVVLDQDGEAEENGVQDQDVHTQLEVQLPLVDVDAQDLNKQWSDKNRNELVILKMHLGKFHTYASSISQIRSLRRFFSPKKKKSYFTHTGKEEMENLSK